MKIKEYLEKHKLTLRQMADNCGVHYATIYRLSIPKDHKSSRRVSLDIAQKIVKGTAGRVTLSDLTGND
jgi:transcriptional regulator with XRE-family HTH domain